MFHQPKRGPVPHIPLYPERPKPRLGLRPPGGARFLRVHRPLHPVPPAGRECGGHRRRVYVVRRSGGSTIAVAGTHTHIYLEI